MSLQPATLEELQQIVRTQRALLPCGGRTKPALSTPLNGAQQLDMSRLSGIIEYEPGEYTFTAYAGTPVRDVVTELTRHGQYLPFDPLLVQRGATLGGTVAANTGGPGRYRYGGVRDFLLGVHFVDGKGQLVKGGGKVVKNSAGFDLPKFMVGSLGRYGIFVDLSFKVFPQPPAYRSLQVTYPALQPALQATYRLATALFDIEALDLVPLEGAQVALWLRLAGFEEALPGRVERLQSFLKSKTEAQSAQISQEEAERDLWQQVSECQWVPEGFSLSKVPLSPKTVPVLDEALPATVVRRYSAGGNVAWLATPDLETLEAILTRLALSGLVLLGLPGHPYLGPRPGLSLAQRVKQALDPSGKFLEP
jgi:glycolate oxidase FAD binding subunit